MRLRLALALMLALATLPGTAQAQVRASSEVGAYADTDHVYVVTPTIAGSVANPTAGYSLGGRYLVDVVSAASVDIVSTASRRWEEVRHVGAFEASYKPGTFGVQAGVNVSSEPDYLSWSAGGAIMQDLRGKSMTLLLGFTHGHDVAGRTGTPFSVFSHPLDRNGFKGGLSLVLGARTVLSLGGDVIVENGDPSKVYRYVPMFAPGTSVPRGASIDQVTSLRLSARPLEQLPLTRQRFALSALIVHRASTATLRVDERIYADSWGLKATTTDARYLFDLSRRVELGPHLRFHAQTPVDFWQRAYIVQPGFDFPALRTGDRELGPLINVTGGGRLRWGLASDEHPKALVLGLDLNVTSSQYLDDLYTTHRWSEIAALSLEAEF